MLPTLAEKLDQARAEIARDRAAAFVSAPPRICGMELSPVTLRSYTRLIAFDSPFVTGAPVDIEALFAFIWIHHPRFAPYQTVVRRRVLREVWRALNPRCPNLNAFVRLVSQFPGFRWARHLGVPTAEERFADAVGHIRHLLTEALIDFPRASEKLEVDEDGNEKAPQIEANGPTTCLTAQILNVFARDLRMSNAEAEAMPLKKVAQLFRECVASAGTKGITLMHPAEARVWREELET